MTLGPPPARLPDTFKAFTLPKDQQLVRFFDPGRGTWKARRTYGPIVDMRFDHHRLPRGIDPDRSVWYASTSLLGAVAESFGRMGVIDRRTETRVVVATRRTDLRLLDLVGVAARAVGLTQEVATSTDYFTCQAWARSFYEQYPDLHGLRWWGRQSGSICILLNDRVPDEWFDGVDFPVQAPEVWPRVVRAARACRIRVV